MTAKKWVGILTLLGVLGLRVVAVYAGEESMNLADAKKMVAAMTDAKTNLPATIKIAQDSCKGKAVSAQLEMEKDAVVGAVYCLAGDKLMDVDVDIKSAKVTESKEIVKHEGKGKKSKSQDDEMTPATAKKIGQVMEETKMTLATAIKAAEDDSKGQAVLAHGEIEDGKLIIAVFCVAGEKLMDIEDELFAAFDDQLFDFHVWYLEGRPLEDELPRNCRVIYQRG